MYADDTLVIWDVEPVQLMHLRLVLKVFEGISSLHVNMIKSLLVPINVVSNNLILVDILGFEVGNLPSIWDNHYIPNTKL